ncbi:hypothetical protein ACWDSJ_03050 [Nocardia sp. NPDC003482]
MDGDEWLTPEQRAIRRKNRIRLAIVGPIALLIVVIAIVAYVRNPEDHSPKADQISPAFLGEWKGVADNGHDSFDVVLTITGDNADHVATSSSTDKATGARCERTESLSAVSDTELTLATASATGPNCDKADVTVRLHTDGTLDYRTGPVTGTLRRS